MTRLRRWSLPAWTLVVLSIPAFAGPVARDRSESRGELGRAVAPILQDQLPAVELPDSASPEFVLGAEALLDRVEALVPGGPAEFNGLDPAGRAALVAKAVASIKDPVLDLAARASDPATPRNVLLGMSFKIRWQLERESLLFSRKERSEIEGKVAAARARLTEEENSRFEAAMKAFAKDGPGSEAHGEASADRAPLAAALKRLSPGVPYVEGRVYDPAIAAALGADASRALVWDLNHTGENHKDPYHEHLVLRPDFVAALERARKAGVPQILWSQAEHWWVHAFFGLYPEMAKYFAAVIVNEHYMDMTAAEKAAHPETARRLASRPTGKDLSIFRMPVIIDDNDTALPSLAKDAGFKHIRVPRAYSAPDREGDVLLRAVDEAISYLRDREAAENFDWRDLIAPALLLAAFFGLVAAFSFYLAGGFHAFETYVRWELFGGIDPFHH